MKDIYTVIIIDVASGELSTASFFDSGKAQEYVVDEILMDDESIDIDELLDILETQWFYDSGTRKYYIEEAKLVCR